MMEPWHLFQDIKQTHRIPVVYCQVKKLATGNIIEHAKVLKLGKGQAIDYYPKDTSSGKSIYSQGKNCGLANAVII